MDTYQLQPDARRFENWDFAYALVLGIGEAARYALEVNVTEASRRAISLATMLRSELTQVVGLRVLDRGSELAAIVTVEMAARPAPELATLLRQKGINTSATFREYAVIDMDEKHAASALRISPHYYKTEEEIQVLIKTLAELSRRT